MDVIGYIACFFWLAFLIVPETLGRWMADVRFGFEDRLSELRKQEGQ